MRRVFAELHGCVCRPSRRHRVRTRPHHAGRRWQVEPRRDRHHHPRRSVSLLRALGDVSYPRRVEAQKLQNCRISFPLDQLVRAAVYKPCVNCSRHFHDGGDRRTD